MRDRGRNRRPRRKARCLEGSAENLNQALWDVENQIRAKEASKSFDQEFVELARSVYRLNDQRGLLKRELSLLLKSGLIEEKQYTPY